MKSKKPKVLLISSVVVGLILTTNQFAKALLPINNFNPTGLFPLDTSIVEREFQNILNNVVGNRRWSDIINVFTNNSNICDDSIINNGTLVFVPIESGLCEELPSGQTIGDILANQQGSFDLPIPSEVETEIRRTVSDSVNRRTPPQIERFQTNSFVESGFVSNTADRAQTQVNVESVLGDEGQRSIRNEMQNLKQDLSTISDESNQALNHNSTQDVMKSLTKIIARKSKIDGAIRSELTHQRISTQYTNINLSNISRSLDQSIRRDLVNDSISQSRLIYHGSQARLW